MLVVRVLDENFPNLTSCLPVCQEAGDPLTDGGGYREAVSVYSEVCPG